MRIERRKIAFSKSLDWKNKIKKLKLFIVDRKQKKLCIKNGNQINNTH